MNKNKTSVNFNKYFDFEKEKQIKNTNVPNNNKIIFNYNNIYNKPGNDKESFEKNSPIGKLNNDIKKTEIFHDFQKKIFNNRIEESDFNKTAYKFNNFSLKKGKINTNMPNSSRKNQKSNNKNFSEIPESFKENINNSEKKNNVNLKTNNNFHKSNLKSKQIF